MDHSNTQDKYKKYKVQLKCWEKEFKKKWNRIPSKYDIRDAPQSIRDAYKMYYKLKTTFLQDALNDALSDDEIDVIKSLENNSTHNDTCDGLKLPSDISALIQVSQISTDTISKEETKQLSNETKTTSIKTIFIPDPKKSKLNFNSTLVKSSSYFRRNPKKSLSVNVKSSEASVTAPIKDTIDSCYILPDLETLLTQKVKEQSIASSKYDIPWCDEKIKRHVTTSVDRKWLNRTSENHISLGIIDDNFALSNINVTKMTSTYKDENKIDIKCKILNEETNDTLSNGNPEKSDSESIVSDSEDERNHQNVSQAAKRRKIQSEIKTQNIHIKLEDNDIRSNTRSEKKFAIANNYEVLTSNNLFLKKETVNFENAVEKPELLLPNIEDVQYNMILDNQNISYTPRLKLKDLQSMNEILVKYDNIKPKKEQLANSPASYNGYQATAQKKLKEKIVSGKLNDNFVMINIQRKKFVRGKQSINYSKYKKRLWKSKKNALSGPNMNMNGCDGGTLMCFNCGQEGHFEINCKFEGDSLLPVTAAFDNDSILPSLKHEKVTPKLNEKGAECHVLSKMSKTPNVVSETEQHKMNSSANEIYENIEYSQEQIEKTEYSDVNRIVSNTDKLYIGHQIPDEFLLNCGFDTISFEKEDSFYHLEKDGKLLDVTPEVLEALHLFGHREFRKGQDRAIMRILSGLSTLVTLSTGSGKSLCYQLPAYLYSRFKNKITLVISPLVSLMEDQVTDIPIFLRAQCLHTNQTPKQRLKILKMINNKELDILLVSPEAVVASEQATAFGSILRQLPPIAFACIDEAHCVSQWSHNFRPSYLMICKVLKKSLGIKTILGLTATATLPTRLNIIDHLGITDGEHGIISDIPMPNNLLLSVSHDENRDKALIDLFTCERFKVCQSVIIYCTRREECERIATLLRTSFQDENFKPKALKRARSKWCVEPYHAGMSASRRRSVQNAFMKNELRIVVATIAFGMGINKPDIRAIIHYNMPKNFESYVQEVGRAGRDGKLSYCHLFLDANGNDRSELRRHIYANSVDRYIIRKLLLNIFVPCSCDNTELGKVNNKCSTVTSDEKNKTSQIYQVCSGHEIGFSIKKTVASLDIPEENIATLLCYLELEAKWHIKMLRSTYIMAKVISYNGSNYLRLAAKDCPPLAMAIAVQITNNTFKENANVIEFPVIDIASAIGWNSGVVKYTLKKLEWMEVNGVNKRSAISVNFFDLGFHVRVPGNFKQHEIDEILDSLYNRAKEQEQNHLMQLQHVWESLYSVSCSNYMDAISDSSSSHSDQLKYLIRKYFLDDYPKDLPIHDEVKAEVNECIRNDIYAILNMYPENNFSGRNIARIFHGISSPNYPAVIWSRSRYWRAHKTTNFYHILQMANEIILQNRFAIKQFV